MTLCVRIKRRELGSFPRSFIDSRFDFVFAGDTVLVPVREVPEGYRVEECNPPVKKPGKRLSDILPGVRSFVLIGDIALVSPKVEVDKEELYRAIKEVEPRARLAREVCEENPMTVLDAFTGYGPIAVHLAKKGCYVVAGDLNLDGLLMLLKSLGLNKINSVDIVQYDAHYLPFRDKAFDLTISDNPTVGHEFKPEVCRVAKKAVFYQMAKSVEEVSELLGEANWSRVNEYSKDLFVFKGTIACNDVSNQRFAVPEGLH